MQAIKVENLCKNYKTIKALKNVNLEVKENELYGFLGVNGAGKTTLIKILTGLIKKTSGKAFILGYDIDAEMEKIKQIVDVSPQEVSIAGNLTVSENLKFFSEIYGTVDENEINNIVEMFQLEEVLNQKAKTLSGGWQRRLSIAVGMVSKPKVLFLDEPSAGLDPISSKNKISLFCAKAIAIKALCLSPPDILITALSFNFSRPVLFIAHSMISSSLSLFPWKYFLWGILP